jgi:hypothetical protein
MPDSMIAMRGDMPGRYYVEAVADGRLDDAKTHLLSEIATAKAASSPAMLAGIAQRLGSVLLKQGDQTSAIALYELSECLDSTSMLAKLDYAKFLLNEVGNRSAAAAKAELILAMTCSAPFPGTHDDFGSDEYADAAQRLLAKATELGEP